MGVKLASFCPSGTWNIQIAPRVLQNLCIPVTLHILGWWQCSTAPKHLSGYKYFG